MLTTLSRHALNPDQVTLIQAQFKVLLSNCRLSDGRSGAGLSSLPNHAGCYLWLVEFEGQQFCAYAGRTNSIRRRAADYSAPFQMHSPNDFKMRLFQEALTEALPTASLHLYFEVVPIEQCPAREAELIQRFRPLLNTLQPPDGATRVAVENVYRSHYRSALLSRASQTDGAQSREQTIQLPDVVVQPAITVTLSAPVQAPIASNNAALPTQPPQALAMNQAQAVWQAMTALGGTRSIKEVTDWIEVRYPNQWKDFGTPMADLAFPGNNSSKYSSEQRFLEKVEKGDYRIRQSGRFVIG